MAATEDHGLARPVDGSTAWGAGYRDAMDRIDQYLPFVMGNIWVADNNVETVITAADTPTRIELGPGAESVLINGNLDYTVENGLTYTGSTSRVVSVYASGSLASIGNNQTYRLTVQRNNQVVPNLRSTVFIGAGGDMGSVSITGLMTLNANDSLTITVTNIGSTNNVIVVDGSMVVSG